MVCHRRRGRRLVPVASLGSFHRGAEFRKRYGRSGPALTSVVRQASFGYTARHVAEAVEDFPSTARNALRLHM